jgi:hypothetical protein
MKERKKARRRLEKRAAKERAEAPLFVGEIPDPTDADVRAEEWRHRRKQASNAEHLARMMGERALDRFALLNRYHRLIRGLDPEGRARAGAILFTYPRAVEYLPIALRRIGAELGLGEGGEEVQR